MFKNLPGDCYKILQRLETTQKRELLVISHLISSWCRDYDTYQDTLQGLQSINDQHMSPRQFSHINERTMQNLQDCFFVFLKKIQS